MRCRGFLEKIYFQNSRKPLTISNHILLSENKTIGNWIVYLDERCVIQELFISKFSNQTLWHFFHFSKDNKLFSHLATCSPRSLRILTGSALRFVWTGCLKVEHLEEVQVLGQENSRIFSAYYFESREFFAVTWAVALASAIWLRMWRGIPQSAPAVHHTHAMWSALFTIGLPLCKNRNVDFLLIIKEKFEHLLLRK